MKLRFLSLAVVGIVIAGPMSTAHGASNSDTAAAKRALLKRSDVSANLTEQSVDTSDDNSGIGTSADCRRYQTVRNAAHQARTGRANVTFEDSTGNEKISETIGFTKSTGTVKRLANAFAYAGTGRCLRAFLKSSLQQQAGKNGSVSVTVQASSLPKLGDQRAGYDILVKVPDGNGGVQAVAFGFVEIRIGRAAVLVQFQTLSGDLIDQRDGILKVATKRLQAAVK